MILCIKVFPRNSRERIKKHPTNKEKLRKSELGRSERVNLADAVVVAPLIPAGAGVLLHFGHLAHELLWTLEDGPDEAGRQVPCDVAVERYSNGQ